MSYGKGRFSNLDLPDPTLSYVARRAIKHWNRDTNTSYEFEPGDPVRVDQVGTACLLKYIRTRLIVLPVAPGDAVPPEAGAALLAERQPQDIAPAPELIEKPAPAVSELEEALAAPIKSAPKAAKAHAKLTEADLDKMSKAELMALSTERGLGMDSRLPLGALRVRVAAALKL